MDKKTINNMIADIFLQSAQMLETGESNKKNTIAIISLGNELGEDVIHEAAIMAANRGIFVKVIGNKSFSHKGIEFITVENEAEAHKTLSDILKKGEADGCVTMHSPFPIGVATIGRLTTPSKGKQMYVAATTGTSALHTVESMVKNAIYGIVTAKACGIDNPTVGILNIDGARQTEIALRKLQQNGYPITFATSARKDGGVIMRGNDLLTASCDIIVTDSLTGNVVMKLLSSFTTGGNYESVGSGYGPGIGETDELVLIMSRASGTPVIASAIEYADELIKGNYKNVYKQEIEKANKAGLREIIASLKNDNTSKQTEEVIVKPKKEVVIEEICGIEIMDLEEAVNELWKKNIYAESGMGCTGPVILVSTENHKKSLALLCEKGYLLES